MNLLLIFVTLAFAQVGGKSVKDIDTARGQSSYRNYVKNPDQELVGTFVPYVTASGGSLTVETSAPIYGKSFRIDSSASAQTYKWDLKSYDTRFGELSEAQCYAEFKYSMAGLNANPNRDGYKWYVEDGSGNKLTSEQQLISTYDELAVADGPSKIQQTWFVCPQTPGSWKFVVESTVSDATRLIVDDLYVGRDFKIGQVNGSGFFASLKYVGVVNCSWNASNPNFSSFGADLDCNTPSVVGNAQAPATKIPAIVLTNVVPGRYKVTATGYFGSSTTQSWAYRFWDGTTAFGVNAGNQLGSVVNVGSFGSIVGFIEYTSAFTTKQIEIQGYADTVSHGLIANQAGKNDLEITVEYLGPSLGAVGVAQQDYGRTKYTPTLVGVTTSDTLFCDHWRTGEFLNLECKFTATGSSATEARLPLPNNLVTANTWTGVRQAGAAGIYATAVESGFTPLMEPNVGYITFGRQGSATAGLTKLNGSNLIASTQVFSFRALVPIAGWTTTLGPYTFKDHVRTPGVAKPVLVSFRISGSGVVSNQIGSAVQSCTNATPSVCTWVNGFWKDATKVNCSVSDLEGGWLPWVRNYTTTTFSVSSYLVNGSYIHQLQPVTITCHGEAN